MRHTHAFGHTQTHTTVVHSIGGVAMQMLCGSRSFVFGCTRPTVCVSVSVSVCVSIRCRVWLVSLPVFFHCQSVHLPLSVSVLLSVVSRVRGCVWW